MNIGVISDTHGFLDPLAVKNLRGTDLIIHAGDIGGNDILEDLKTIARVYAVRGNMDVGRWSNKLPLTRVVDVGETLLYVLHNLNNLDLDPVSSGFHAVISGHLHRPIFEKQNGILYINPGSASQPRHEYSPTIALLSFKSTKASSISVNFVEL